MPSSVNYCTVYQLYQHKKRQNAAKYDSVTIYFSDILHFIQMVEESSPPEVSYALANKHLGLGVMVGFNP